MEKQKNNPVKTQVQVDNDAPITSEVIRHHIKDAVVKLGDKATKEEKLDVAKVLTKIFEQGMTPREAMKITEVETSEFYSAAYQMFSNGKFVEARELFKLLLVLEPTEAGFALSLGACHQHLKDYEYALEAYMLASTLSSADPVPLFYAYECYKILNDPTSASIMLSNVIYKSGDNPAYQKVKGRAELLLKELEKQMAQEAEVK